MLLENKNEALFNTFGIHDDILTVAEDILDRFESIHEDGGDVYDDLFQAMNEGMIYTADQWTMMQYYCTPQDASFEDAWMSFEGDLLSIIENALTSL